MNRKLELTDLQIIKQLEQEIGNELNQLDLVNISRLTNGYAIDENKNVVGLNLDSLEFSTIPNNLINLKNLQILSLSSNKIEKLPESFTQLKNLSELDLRYNKLKELLESFGELQNLSKLYLYGNPLENPPLNIIEQGINAIRNYLKDLD